MEPRDHNAGRKRTARRFLPGARQNGLKPAHKFLAAVLILGGVVIGVVSLINFSGRGFDDLSISAAVPDHTMTPTGSAMSIPSDTPTPGEVGLPTDTPAATGTPPRLPGVNTYDVVEIQLEGPASRGMGDPNPFLVEVQVVFTGPGGQIYIVPAFYDGDGRGGLDGNVWRARFAPDEPGAWTYLSSSPSKPLDGQSGAFTAALPPDCPGYSPGGLANFSCLGRLEFAGDHYLKFRNGVYWIKGGLDDPENLLGEAFGDWSGKKAAIDYLASQGVNSVYMVLNNISGDRLDTWPWAGNTADQAMANDDRFNVAKLLLWEDFFTYVQEKGIVLHLVLDDDSAWAGYDHRLYYRELIARFGHHPGIIWNIAEEANEIYSDQEQSDLAALLRSLDPYDHPISVHRKASWPFFGDPNFDAASIQAMNGGLDFTTADLGDLNGMVISHRQASVSAGRLLPIMIDELPRVTKVDAATQLKMRAEALYPIYLGGGHRELHYFDVYGQGGTVAIEDLEPMLLDMRRARQFLESLPFSQMAPCNELLSPAGNLCFGKPGETYALYLPEGGSISIDLRGASGAFSLQWFDPRSGVTTAGGVTQAGVVETLTAPDSQDWALTMIALPPTAIQPPTATPSPTATPAPPAGVLLLDNFSRANGNTARNGWTEVERSKANVDFNRSRVRNQREHNLSIQLCKRPGGRGGRQPGVLPAYGQFLSDPAAGKP